MLNHIDGRDRHQNNQQEHDRNHPGNKKSDWTDATQSVARARSPDKPERRLRRSFGEASRAGRISVGGGSDAVRGATKDVRLRGKI
jgi:hypothetical protein